MKRLSFLLASALLLSAVAFAQDHPGMTQDRGDEARPAQGHEHSAHDAAERERITHGPVVESFGNSWATVAWSTDTGGSSVVHYGTDRNHLDKMAESPYAASRDEKGVTHRVKIDHLRPGTTYFYAVDSGQGQGTGTSADSSVEEFTTKR
jgi:phosphodiesterase/alkaline phosphatase D-like protein